MKILLSNRDDILKRKQTYEYLSSKRESEYQNYLNSQNIILQKIIKYVQDKIGETFIKLDVSAQFGEPENVIIVKISHVDKFSRIKRLALSWSYTVELEDSGNISKNSIAYSDINVSDVSKFDELKESIRIFRILNNINWKSLLNVTVPHISKYVTTPEPEYEDFEKELVYEDIEDASNEHKLIKGKGYKLYHSDVYYNITKKTDKSYFVQEISPEYVENKENWPDPYTVRKTKFYDLIYVPIQTLDI